MYDDLKSENGSRRQNQNMKTSALRILRIAARLYYTGWLTKIRYTRLQTEAEIRLAVWAATYLSRLLDLLDENKAGMTDLLGLPLLGPAAVFPLDVT
jgi:hypothetical protein